MEPSRRSAIRAACILALASALGSEADVAPTHTELTAPEHDYWNRPLDDPLTRFVQKEGTPPPLLDTSSELAFLTSFLAALGIPVASQLLLFSPCRSRRSRPLSCP